ncbi:MAG: DUF2383 domain-containing protein [Verrucomicrobiales bacterium]|nr:DUF2383 domain-containing protein [Verrucomicrobiales bacterium]
MKTTINETSREECIDICNKMLRGERSAVETYNLAIDKFESEPATSQLRRIRDEHQNSVADLESNVRNMGGDPDDSSGAWGVFAKAVQGTANLFGEESAIESLEQGEEKGLDDYRDAVEEGLLPECHALFTNRLIPRVESHLRTLKVLEETV